MNGSPIFCSDLRIEGAHPIQTIICRAIQKRSTDRKHSYKGLQIPGLHWGPWFLWVDSGRLPVTVFIWLNDWQSEFREFWAMVLHSDERLSPPAQLNAVASILPCLLLFIAYPFVQWNEFDFFRMVWFPKFVKTFVLLWKQWPAVDLKISKCHSHGLALWAERQPRVRSAISTALLDRLADV